MHPQVERNKSILQKYIPESTVFTVAMWVHQYDFKLKIKKSRSTKLGDYRHPIAGQNHQITINHDLNKYAFLITLIHEVAHLTCWLKFKNSVKPHGDEWKKEYHLLIDPFIKAAVFPEDITHALIKHFKNPKASSCTDVHLYSVLKKYDTRNSNHLFVKDLPNSALFETKEGRVFKRGEKVRTRYKCVEQSTGRVYLFSPLADVLLKN
ncbi:MAG: SprT-like domain-containing protein [Bacteroidetes bacterium]|nr:SprT-like domain-containing protein [Bacteroidota bacterium]